MFKKFKINHEGFHRIGILLGCVLILLTPWFVVAAGRGFVSLNLDILFFYHIGAVYEFFAYGDHLIIFHLTWYPIFYFLGYFLVKIFYWILQGFNK